MNSVALAAFGWLVPGGAFLLKRRYLQFAGFAFVVSAAFIAGILLGGSCRWPQPAELTGLDSFTAHVFQASVLAKLLAGGPYLVAWIFDGPRFLEGRLHEYGTTLLIMSGIFNVLAIASAFDLQKENH